jgi:hypothetical protein
MGASMTGGKARAGRLDCAGGHAAVTSRGRRDLLAAATLALSLLLVLSGVSCRQILGIRSRHACGDPRVIDNFEDGDFLICEAGGRRGGWFFVQDGTGTLLLAPDQDLTPSRGGPGTSQFAARMTGSGFTKWGALMGLVLNAEAPPGPLRPYDARGNGGVRFRMKSNAPISVAFPTSETTPVADGGTCAGNFAAGGCDDHFQFLIAAPAPDEWVEYDVPFTALARVGGGGSATWSPSRLIGLNFQVPVLVPADRAFDVWVDDIRFYQCSGAACVPTCTDPNATLACPATSDSPAGCRPAAAGCGASISICDDLMLDNMEDGDASLCQSGDRHGVWYVAGDASAGATLAPADFAPSLIPGWRGTSQYAAHFAGAGFNEWGALMGFHLDIKGLAPQPYDLGTTAAIKFWMKGNAPVSIAFAMRETTPIARGGTCVGNFDDNGCDDHFQFQITAPTPDEWVEYTVPYDALSKQGSGGAALWNPSQVVSINFGVSAGSPFDVWVDDVRLDYCSSLTPCLPTCSDPAAPVPCPASGGGHPARCAPAGTDCRAETNDVFDVWGSAADDVWVTSVGGTVAHWDGSAWSPLATTATTRILQSVWGSGPGDVWAVGDGGAIVHWDGSRWSVSPSGTSSRLESVWGSGPRDVWAIGDNGTIVHWDGSRWSASPSGTTEFFIGNVWGSGPDDVWAVGTAGTAAHWNGSAWSASKLAGIVVLFGLWGSGSNDVWAVGGDGGHGEGIVHWNGSAWSATKSGTTQPLFGVWGSGANDIWAVGSGGTIIHWNGSAWSASESGTTQQLFDVWGSGSSDVWVVGVAGTLLHWDGSAWSRRSIPRT